MSVGFDCFFVNAQRSFFPILLGGATSSRGRAERREKLALNQAVQVCCSVRGLRPAEAPSHGPLLARAEVKR